MKRARNVSGSLAVAALLAGLGLVAARDAMAHQDPSGCFQSGPAIVIGVFRADGVTGVSGTVSPCETIKYRATLQKATPTDTTICAFEGGMLTFTTPDGTVHTINGNVPCLGGTLTATEDCSLAACAGDPCTTPTLISYMVRTQDLKCLGGANVGTLCASNADCPSSACGITAGGNYGPGILHDNAIDTTQPPVTAATPKGTGVTPCPASTECITSICTPTKTDGVRTGLCDTSNVANSTPCSDTDGNFCTTAGCDGQGNCDQNHMTKTCPPADQCNGVCDTITGKCTPKTSTPCTDTDGNACTTAGCELSPTNPELGVCVQTHMFASNSTPCADTDNNACTTAGCNGQGTCDQNHMQIQSTSNCANPLVGAATDCTVLELDGSKVDVTGPAGGIVGDFCIGPNGHLSITGSEFVTGEVRLSPGATFSKSGSGTVGSVETDQDLSAEINAAIAASADAAGRTCTINLTSIKDATTINATGGGTAPTVVCVQDVVLNGRTVTLSGVAGDSFIFNVTGKFVLNGGSRIVVSGIEPKDVLYNLLRSGGQGGV